MYKISYYNQKLFFFRYASKVVGYHWSHVSKGQTILPQWCDFTSSGDSSTSSGDSSTILNAYCQNGMIQKHIYATWEIEPNNEGLIYTDDCQGGVEGQFIFLILAPMCFFVNKLCSVCRYMTGTFNGCSKQDEKCQQNRLEPLPFENVCQESVTDSHFSCCHVVNLHIQDKSENILHGAIAYRCAKSFETGV